MTVNTMLSLLSTLQVNFFMAKDEIPVFGNTPRFVEFKLEVTAAAGNKHVIECRRNIYNQYRQYEVRCDGELLNEALSFQKLSDYLRAIVDPS